MRAVSEGKKLGYEQGYKKGKEDCLRDLDVDAAYTAAFEEGRRKGEENKKWLWETLGHSYHQRCMSPQPTPETISIGVQSDLPYVPPMVSSSTQTSPLSLVTVDTQTSITTKPSTQVSPPLDWAEDTISLPILPTPTITPPRAPCDFSGLRSSQPNPFSSLQRRSKQFRSRTHRFPHSNLSFTQPLHTPHHYPPSSSIPLKHPSPPDNPTPPV